MKKLALIIFLASCNSADDDTDGTDLYKSGPPPAMLVTPPQIPTMFIPDTIWAKYLKP